MLRRYFEAITKLNNQKRNVSLESGQIAMAAVIFFLLVILIILGTYGTLAVGQLSAAGQILASKKIYATAESGIEDAAYRAEHYVGFSLDNTSNPLLLNNNAQAVITVIDEDPDEIAATKDYRLTSSASGNSIYRKAEMLLIIPDGAFYVNVKGAVQVGSMGINTGGGVTIQGNSLDAGKFYSNGSFISGPAADKIEGDLVIARGFNNDTNSTVKTISDPPDATIKLQNGATAYDGAQQFIAPATGVPKELRLYMRSSVSSKVLGDCYNNIYIVGSRYMGGSSYDFPNSALVYATGGAGWSSTPIPTSLGWVTIALNQNKTLISNEAYWIILDQKTSGVCAGWIDFGSHSNDDLDQNTDVSLYYNNPTFYPIGPAFGGVYGNQRSEYTNRHILVQDYTVFANIVNPSPVGRDISFKLSIGDSVTVADSAANNGKSAVSGNLIAPLIKGIDVWKEAFYDSVNTKPSPGTVSTWDANMTIAGASMFGGASKQRPTAVDCPKNAAGGDSTLNVPPPNYQCINSPNPNYICRDFNGQLTTYAPNFSPYTSALFYCQCVDGDVSTSYCHDLDASGSLITDPEKQIPEQTPLFTAEDGPISANLIELDYNVVSGGPVSCYIPADSSCSSMNWVPEPARNPPSPPSQFTFRRYDPDGNGFTDTLAAPTGSSWIAGSPLKTLRIETATTTLQLPAYINGNVDLNNLYDGRLELSSGPPNTQVNAETQPYILWIKGDLTMRNSNTNCSITAHQPYGSYLSGRGVAGTEIPDVYGNLTPKASIKIFVEGRVDVFSPCVARGYWADPRSYIQIISLNPGVGDGGSTDFAIRLRSSSKGSAYYTPRGGVLVDFSGLTQVRSLATNFLKLNVGTTLQYIEGLPDPYSEFGGDTPIGSDIQRFKEIE